MTPTIFDMVKEFQKTFVGPVRNRLCPPHPRRGYQRLGLVYEQADKLTKAVDEQDVVKMADAMGDLIYVTIGFAMECGINIEAVLGEIHKSNMTKVGADGRPRFREDGKVLKGPNYRPPNVKEVAGRVLRT